MSKDPNYAVKVEKAIAEKYGKEAIVNPKSQWDDDKEKEYLDGLKSNYRYDKAESERVDLDGVLISKELLNRESERSCPTCNTYSFKSVDDLKEFINAELICGKSKVKILKPEWI